MKLTIDNLDGLGAVQYSAQVCAEGPVRIERVLNAPSKCSFSLSLGGTKLAVPARRGRVIVSTNGGDLLFTGYLVSEPDVTFVGCGTSGPIYQIACHSVSDEWLLDKQSVFASTATLEQPDGAALTTLTNRVESGRLSTTSVTDNRLLGYFQPEAGKLWSTNAAELASAGCASYRVLNGNLALVPTGSVTHALAESDGTLTMSSLRRTSTRQLANDITVTGDLEPSAYVTEMFLGDGATSKFVLSQAPYRGPAATTRSSLLTDSFSAATADPRLWTLTDAGHFLSLGAAGLTIAGGTGADTETMLTAVDPIELGGSLVAEAGTFTVTGASSGLVCGFYSGSLGRNNCFAGFNVRQSGGSTVLCPWVNGQEVGTIFTLASGHAYTLRLRLHCTEMQRVAQTFYTSNGAAIHAFGGGTTAAPMDLVFEVQDLSAAINVPATVLYDGKAATSPATCSFAAVSSLSMQASMTYVRVRQTGSAFVRSTLPSGAQATRRIGSAGEGVDCTVATGGVVTFLAGRIPVAGELITVTYRTEQRAFARIANTASVQAESSGGFAGQARWLGKLLRPEARTSADCENAAMAILSVATDRAAALTGQYESSDLPDVWPGDNLSLSTDQGTQRAIVRTVVITDAMAEPEDLRCQVDFAGDWAKPIGLELSETVATDVLLPATAQAASGQVLNNLSALTVISVTGTAVQIDAGTAPPAGGGFEVRRRDLEFGPGVNQDLVLRSAVRGFTIPRATAMERFYIRMYDGSVPPLYSRNSSAVFTDIPLG